ncbi:hypothetical protein GCM10011506_45420 [Marivirga lumbricoides]|uniref:HTH tetR-type domain-containing protein n=1 Tax=Marivirga lumbricoides TaxID=1046115 RepID=A0ABQ1N5M6_9BACT|nr:hypothetical protein GCM10011506_45420 [Marivirga lumbricoides]
MEEISEKKKAIFESALKLVQKCGFHGTPMSMIAKNANVAAGTLYLYFESKDELLTALFNYNKKKVETAVDQYLNDETSYKEQFFKIWLHLYKFYITNTEVLKYFEQYINSPYNVERNPLHFRGKLYEFLDKGIKNNQFFMSRTEMLRINPKSWGVVISSIDS